MASMIVTKKTLNSLGGRMNESAGSQVSAFARKQMEKFGWTEGKGLGKNEDGISKHVKITKREEKTGLGSEVQTYNDPDTTETWWHDAFDSALKSISKKKKRKRDRESGEDAPSKPPSYDELFAATGGARLGMRARADQSGKLLRTSDSKDDPSSSPVPSVGVNDCTSPKHENDTSDATVDEQSEITLSKKSKKELKIKKKDKAKKAKKDKKRKDKS